MDIFSGAIASNGGLVIGGGTEILDGVSSDFAGMTTIKSGMLEVGDTTSSSAILGSDVMVDGLGTLRGHGMIGGNVTKNGHVYPAGSIGILAVNGNYTQTSGGSMNIEITPNTTPGTGYDKLTVNGTANLAGNLTVKVDTGTYAIGSSYDILHANNGVSGTFSIFSYNPAFAAYLMPVLNYSSNVVTLAISPNRAAFATGRIYAAGADATDHGYWLHAIGTFGQANGYDFNEKGFVFGEGFSVSPNLVVGGTVSNIYTNTTGSGSSVTGSSFGVPAYSIYTAERLKASASFSVGHIGTSLSRPVLLLGETAQAGSNGTYEGAALRLRYSLLDSARYFLGPYGAASYLHTALGSSQETGAGILSLRDASMHTDLVTLGAGKISGVSIPVRYGTLTAWTSIGFAGTPGNTHTRNTEYLGSFSLGETALTTPQGSVVLAIGLQVASKNGWRLAASWNGQYGRATSAESFDLQAKYIW